MTVYDLFWPCFVISSIVALFHLFASMDPASFVLVDQPFIFRFQAALIEYGVNKHDIFQTNDLSEKKDIANVTNTIYALGRAVS